jgi:glycerol-3-phosphate dehydrogenase
MSRAEQDALIRENPAYGKIVCRCECVTEGEILDALRSPVPPGSVDAVKRRTRAGMGRCQGGFCQPRVLEIMARELGRKRTEVTLKGEGTEVLLRRNRGEEAGE